MCNKSINIVGRIINRLMVFKNGVLRGIFGSKRKEVTGKWRRLHNEELHALYCSPEIIWRPNEGG
jgi:hypothetical protein